MIATATEPTRRRVVILGGGFAGLHAAQTLRHADVEVMLIDRRNFHLFQPLLYQVATGELSPSNIAAPLRVVLRHQKNTTVELGEVQSIDVAGRRLTLSDREVEFDDLIVATGSTHHYFGNDHWAEHAPGLKTIENATQIRRIVLGAFEAAERCNDPAQLADILTFVIVGAGPTGCELAGSLAEIANHTLRNDFRNIDPAMARIIVVDASGKALSVYPQTLCDRAAADLKNLGCRLVFGARVADIDAQRVLLTAGDKSQTEPPAEIADIVHTDENGDWSITTRNVIWAAGVKASKLGKSINDSADLAPGPGGRVRVNPDCSVPGHPHLFVAGDLAYFPLPPNEVNGDTADPNEGHERPSPREESLPGLAPVAMQMGAHAAKCIIADRRGKPRKTFHYRDRGSLAVIGRFRAVGMIFGRPVQGFIAWFAWLAIHLMYVSLFRNRLLVLMQWGWTFLTHDRSSRLIVGTPTPAKLSMEQSTGWDVDPAMPQKPPEASPAPRQALPHRADQTAAAPA